MDDYADLRARLLKRMPHWNVVDAENMREAAAAIASQAAELANCKTVMIAAAEEIAAHWDAHCDAEGYGPQNLQRRLEEGIPAEYGYTAGAFATLRAERDAAVALLDEVRSHFTRDDDLPDGLLDRIDASLRTEQEQQL